MRHGGDEAGSGMVPRAEATCRPTRMVSHAISEFLRVDLLGPLRLLYSVAGDLFIFV